MAIGSSDFALLVKCIKEACLEVQTVTDVVSFRPSYRYFPVRLSLKLKNNQDKTEVLKVSGERPSLQFERDILVALHEIGFSVPQVRSPIFEFYEDGEQRWGMLLQEIDGYPLDWLGLENLNDASRTCGLTLVAIEHLHVLTETMLQHPIASQIPKRTLFEELALVKRDAGTWTNQSFFLAALETLEEIIPQITVPLVFSNGDYNPLNFIARGENLVGWIDFEHACFEDPHIGFAKFFLWADDYFGWSTGIKAGLVERYLFAKNVMPSDFYGRVVLRGLYYIHLCSINNPPFFMIDVVKKYTNLVQKVLKKS